MGTKSHLEAQKRWRLKNADKQRTLVKAWQTKNRDYVNAKAREKYSEDPEKYRLILKRKRDKNRDAYNKSERLRRDNPQSRAKRSAYESKRRAIKASASVACSGVNEYFRKTKTSNTVACYYCGSRVQGSISHIDHMVPLARGGAHGVENLCVSCPSCNLRKGKKTHLEFTKEGQLFLL